MNCETLIDRLDELLDGTLGATEQREAERHLEHCARCRELRVMVEGSRELEPIEVPAELTSSILERTSGSVCDAAREQLCELVDRALEPTDSELLRLHVDGCADCAAVAATLQQLSVDLPLLAEIEPGEQLVADVLARTLPRDEPKAAWADRLTAGWNALVQRPRIAWEGAYVGTFVLVLLFGGIPSTLIANVGEKTQELADARPIARLEAEVSSRVLSVRSKGSSMYHVSRGAAVFAARRTSVAWNGMTESLGTLLGRDASEQETDELEEPPEDQDRTQGEER